MTKSRFSDKNLLNRIANLGCIVCLQQGIYKEAEIHHLRTGQGMGVRAGDDEAIGLCPDHHRNGGFGIAIHAGVKTFESNFGLQRELLKKVQELLNDG